MTGAVEALSLVWLFIFFVVAAAGVWTAGLRLTYVVDELADRHRLAKSLVGLLLLSTATSLPEVATTLTAAIQQSQALVLNNLFGGVALQTAILALADFWARGALTYYPRKVTHALEATILVSLMAMMIIIVELGEPLVIGHVGLGSLFVGLVYVGSIWLLRRYDADHDWIPVDLPEDAESEPVIARIGSEVTSRNLAVQCALACFAILVFGVVLVVLAEELAEDTGLGAGFIGVTLLALATSLPELTTSITAVRMGSYTLAISNVFGSNLIMMVLVLPADFLFFSGPILGDVGGTARLSLSFGILVTGLFLGGLIIRRKPRLGPIGLDSALVLAAFGGSLLAYWWVSGR